MKALKLIIFLVIFFSIIGVIFAMFWDVPRPAEQVQKPIQIEIKDFEGHSQSNPDAQQPFETQ